MDGLGCVDRDVAACDWSGWKDVVGSFASIEEIWILLLIDF